MSRRRLLAAAITAVVAALWIVPSDVVRLVARQDEVILGRYSENRAYFLLLATPIALFWAFLLWRGVRFDRVFRFRLYAVLLSFLVCWTAVDAGARLHRKPRYVVRSVEALDHWPHKFKRLQEGTVKARPAGRRYEVHFEDEPGAARSYDPPRPGFEPVDVVLTIDERGFRNPEALERADVVTLGDSFTEGSRVSDDESWPALLRAALGRPLYSLAVSGTSPKGYRNAWIAYGVDLRPRVVVVCIYEGNDLREHEGEKESPWWEEAVDACEDFVKESPLVEAFRDFVEDRLAPIGAHLPLPRDPALAWMPAEIRGEDGVWYAAFEPKEVRRLDVDEAEFSAGKGFRAAVRYLGEIVDSVRACGAEPIVVLAPTKAHVVLPLVWDKVPAAALRDFVAFSKHGLPPPEEFVAGLKRRIDGRERALLEFCAASGVRFVSLTKALRRAAARGRQVYYTYDDHWTRIGHRVAADVVTDVVREALPGSRKR